MADAPFGVMLNTGIVGTFPDMNHPCDRAESLPLAEQVGRCRDTRDGASAGGRLVLTNIAIPPQTPMEAGAKDMDMVFLDDPGLSIARAAALSANFPPVFPDAAIDVRAGDGADGRRYWVTDGGAVENRGAVTLYHAIRQSLRAVPAASKLPPLHIVIADVSALAGPYSESFGFGSVLGAGGQLGLRLESELSLDIIALYCKLGSQVTIHEIDMPPVLLSNGGIGTHWLLPSSLTFKDPNNSQPPVTLSSADVLKVVLSLHSTRKFEYADASNVEKLRAWAKDVLSTPHDKNWAELLRALAAPPAQKPSKCDGVPQDTL